MATLSSVLEEIFHDPNHPASYGGIQSLYRAVKADGRVKPTLPGIRAWLESQDTFTLHKQPRRRYKRNRVFVSAIDEQFEMDLVDMSSLSRYNKGYKYLLTCIDVLSKFAWVVPLKDKRGKTLVKAFSHILEKSNRTPEKVHTDRGTEFTNREFQTFLKDREIHFFTTGNETKASVVERFNRTLKNRMYRYFTDNSTLKYIDVLSKLVSAYNGAYHRSIKTTPKSVNSENESVVWNNLYPQTTSKQRPYTFKLGDSVRIAKTKLKFEKSYLPNFSDEIFTIYRRYAKEHPVYKLIDLKGDVIDGTFYEAELQKVSKTEDDLYKIEKVIRKKKRNGRTQYFVKWKGWGDKFNSWVDDLNSLNSKYQR